MSKHKITVTEGLMYFSFCIDGEDVETINTKDIRKCAHAIVERMPEDELCDIITTYTERHGETFAQLDCDGRSNSCTKKVFNLEYE